MCNTREPREQKDTTVPYQILYEHDCCASVLSVVVKNFAMNTTQTMNATHTRRAASVVYASYGFTRVEPWFLT